MSAYPRTHPGPAHHIIGLIHKIWVPPGPFCAWVQFFCGIQIPSVAVAVAAAAVAGDCWLTFVRGKVASGGGGVVVVVVAVVVVR